MCAVLHNGIFAAIETFILLRQRHGSENMLYSGFEFFYETVGTLRPKKVALGCYSVQK